jgi:hypothetical protein
MKKMKLLDILPTIFGLIAILGLASWTLIPSISYWSYSNLSPMMLYGGAALALVTGLISVALAALRRSFTAVHVLNIVWLLAAGIFFVLFLMAALAWSNVHWTF